MPYTNLDDLPDRIKNNLPKHAQEIYKETFNSAWKNYKDPSKRRDNASLEEVSQRVAWSAVKNSYKKNEDGKWVKIE